VASTVNTGEVLGVGVLVGAGRTELLRLIYGLERADSGSVRVDGRQLPPGRPGAAIAAGLGMAPEDRKSQGLLLDWSLTRNVTLADLGRFSPRIMLNRGAEKAAATEQLRALKTVPDDSGRIVRELSGGNQQKVVLARWLLRRCRVLLFDEPTRGVDVGAKTEIYRVIADLAANGIAVVVVSSEMPELLGLCSRILVMREGRVVAEADGATANEFELLRHAVAPTDTDPVLVEEIA
jgi:ribose transport system ATP-binding protein